MPLLHSSVPYQSRRGKSCRAQPCHVESRRDKPRQLLSYPISREPLHSYPTLLFCSGRAGVGAAFLSEKRRREQDEGK